jgi:hypothetical protein
MIIGKRKENINKRKKCEKNEGCKNKYNDQFVLSSAIVSGFYTTEIQLDLKRINLPVEFAYQNRKSGF